MTEEPTPLPANADPQLSSAFRARLARYGASEATAAGQVLFNAGDVDPDFFFLERGTIDIVGESFNAPSEAIIGTLSMDPRSIRPLPSTASMKRGSAVTSGTLTDSRVAAHVPTSPTPKAAVTGGSHCGI